MTDLLYPIDKPCHPELDSGSKEYKIPKRVRNDKKLLCSFEEHICCPKFVSESKNENISKRLWHTQKILCCIKDYTCHPELVSGSKLKLGKAFQKFAAFTLAEVLITLAIVGIVAAMTIPTLVSKIQERQFHVKWKECYSILNNAFKLTVAENPKMVVSELNNYDPTREFIEEILKHIQVVDTCGVSNDFDNNICDNYAHYKDYQIKYKWSGVANIYSRYTTLAGGKLNAYDFNKKAVLLKNGASIYFGGLWSGLTIVVDVNNFNGGPNVIGKDVYAISMTKSGNYYNVQYIEDLYFRPYGAEGTQTEIRGYQDCAADIGKTSGSSVDALYEAPGAGCSFKYLNEK